MEPSRKLILWYPPLLLPTWRVRKTSTNGGFVNSFIIHSNFILVSYWSTFTGYFSMSGNRDIIFAEYCELFDGAVQKKIIGRWWRNYLKAAKITKQQKWPATVWKVTATVWKGVFLQQSFSCIYRSFECIIKQLLDSTSHNIKNYPDFDQCYPRQASAYSR